jgi:hypothetical protein
MTGIKSKSEPVWSVYFLQAVGNGPIKIGCTFDIAKRMMTIQAWCPFKLELKASIEGDELLEKILHQKFSGYRMHGEWFEPHDELMRVMKSLNEDDGFPDDVADMIDAAREEYWATKDKKAEKLKTYKPSGKKWTEERRRKFSASRKLSDERRRAAKGGLRKINYEAVLSQAATRGE